VPCARVALFAVGPELLLTLLPIPSPFQGIMMVVLLLVVYTTCWILHFVLLCNSGPGNDWMTREFLSTLNGTNITLEPRASSSPLFLSFRADVSHSVYSNRREAAHDDREHSRHPQDHVRRQLWPDGDSHLGLRVVRVAPSPSLPKNQPSTCWSVFASRLA
jgi:hypothetical protein